MTRYYDYVLGLIPVALFGVTAFLNLVGLSLTMSLPVGAGVALALMAHAMFVRDPIAGADSTAAGSTAAGSGPGGGDRGGPMPSSGTGHSSSPTASGGSD